MKQYIKNMSIKNKITALVVSIVTIVTFAGLSIIVYFDIMKTRQALIDNTYLKANLVSQYCITPLIFDRTDAAHDALEKLSTDINITNGHVLNQNNVLFASYDKNSIPKDYFVKADLKDSGYVFNESSLILKYPIEYLNVRYGTLFLRVSTSSIQKEIRSFVFTIGIIGFFIILTAYMLITWLQEFISRPITNLSHAVKEISEKSDLSYRVSKEADDEIGVLYDEFNNMLERLNQNNIRAALAEEALRGSEQRYKELIENMGEGIALFDSEGRFLFTNPAANLLYGANNHEIIGRDFIEFVVPEQHKIVYKEREKRRGGETSSYEIKILNLKKEFKYLLQTATPKYNDKGEFAGSFSILRDITDRKIVEQELLKAKEHAEKSDKFKSEFLAQMSHEIRSPLNVILSFTSMIKDEIGASITPEMTVSFNSINKGARRIIRTIDMILNMAEIQTGTFEIHPKTLALDTDILQSLVQEYSVTAAQKGLKINFENKIGSVSVVADEYSITQVFSNLIDNAIKYTRQGSISVILWRNDRNLCVDIKDTGIGISKEYLPNLFNAFSQEEMGYNRRFDGNGLGLALVKKYCELNNAVINVTSEKNSGTTFTVEFVLRVAPGEKVLSA